MSPVSFSRIENEAFPKEVEAADDQTVAELPLSGRNFIDLIDLVFPQQGVLLRAPGGK